jgi:hypothetical protein
MRLLSRPLSKSLVLALGLSLACSAICQETTSVDGTTAQRVKPVPLPLLYRHFLAYQNHLDRAAAALDKEGKNGEGLRSHFQKKLDFTDAQFANVRDAGLRLESELQKIDAQAKAIIDKTRAAFPNATMSQPETLPLVPPELTKLQDERNALIEREVSDLKYQLGAEASAKLDSFLQKEFSQTVTARSVQLPRAHDPAANPVPPFAQEVSR